MKGIIKDKKEGMSIWGAIGLIFIVQIGMILLGVPIMAIKQSPNLKDSAIIPYFDLGAQVIIQIIIIIVLLRWFKNSRRDDVEGRENVKTLVILSSIFIMIGYFLFASNSIHLALKDVAVPEIIEESFRKISMNKFVLIFSLVIVAPIYEEVLFRRIILGEFSKRYKYAYALVFSSIIFGAIHGNIPQFINASIMGLVLGNIYLRTGSLILCIACHATNNLLAVIRGYHATEINFSIIYLVLGIVMVVISYYYFHRETKKVNIGVYDAGTISEEI